jgi:hypothetical protein
VGPAALSISFFSTLPQIGRARETGEKGVGVSILRRSERIMEEANRRSGNLENRRREG